MSTPLEMVLQAIGEAKDDNIRTMMSSVDVVNRLEMNERLQHNYERLDAQVDALLKAKNQCYESPGPMLCPEPCEEEAQGEGGNMPARNQINSPTVNIGMEAAMALNKTVQSGDSAPSTSSALQSKLMDWLKTAGLLFLGAGTVYAVNALFPGTDLDTRNVFELNAAPFDPDTPPVQ